MKLFITAILLASVAQAETSLECKNNRSGKVIMTARILNNKYLSEVDFDFSQWGLREYFVDKKTEMPNRPGKFRVEKGYLANPEGRLTPKEITNNRSPYKGNEEFSWKFGEHTYSNPPNKLSRTPYEARLITSADLSNDVLKTFRFKNRKGERTNAVLIMNPPRNVHQYGDNFLKMFCTSD
jgi:hypothetical protein